MKKVYITPSIEVVKAETSAIIATSPLGISEDTVDSSADDVQLVREGIFGSSSVWDHEWE